MSLRTSPWLGRFGHDIRWCVLAIGGGGVWKGRCACRGNALLYDCLEL